MVTPRKKSRASEHQGSHFSGNDNDLIIMSAPSTEEALVDGHKSNRGGSKHARHTNEHKVSMIEFYESQSLTIAEFINFFVTKA